MGALWDLWHGEKVVGDPPRAVVMKNLSRSQVYSPEFYSRQLCLKMDTMQAVVAGNCTLGG